MKRLKYSITLSLATALLFSLYFKVSGNFEDDVIIVVAIFMFVFLSIGFYIKMFSHITDKRIEFQKLNNVIYSGRANRYIGDVNVGGNLYLTSDKLIFQTNALNFLHRQESVINLKEINDISYEKTNLMVDNSISLSTSTGSEKFVVSDRERWKQQIEKQRLLA